MNCQAPHLVRSRHGIWYVRIVVPERVRRLNPSLPRELRRSTRTASRQRAIAFSRKLCLAFETRFNEADLVMNSNDDWDARPLVQPMLVDLQDPSGRRLRIQTHPWDPPSMTEQIEQLVMSLRGALLGPPVIAAAAPAAPATQLIAPLQSAPAQASSRWLGEAIDDWLREAPKTRDLSDNTVRYTYAPALRVFRELVSTERRPEREPGELAPWDIRLANLTPLAIDSFTQLFWDFPDRQGKRANIDAKQVLAAGGKPQSRENAIKNLDLIYQFVDWAVTRRELAEEVRARLQATLAKTRRKRRKASAQPLDAAPGAGNGYVAWSLVELQRIFGDGFVEHCAGYAHRYWVPVIALHTGMRPGEVSQLLVDDFVRIEGIPCMRLVASQDASTKADKTEAEARKRLKTEASRRVVPVHPRLVSLGLLDYVERRRRAGKEMLFDLHWFRKDGYGKYPGRDFRKRTEAAGVWVKKTKVAHSFRSTLAQALERVGLDSQLIDRTIGHKVSTIRARHYSRNDEGINLPLRIVYEALCKVHFDVEIPAWIDIPTQARRDRRSAGLSATVPSRSAALASDGEDVMTPSEPASD